MFFVLLAYSSLFVSYSCAGPTAGISKYPQKARLVTLKEVTDTGSGLSVVIGVAKSKTPIGWLHTHTRTLNL